MSEFFSSVKGLDLVDILVVAILFYIVLRIIRGTRAVQVLLGILVLVGISFLARALELVTLATLLEKSAGILPFLIIVLFQDQIRRAFASFGDTSILGLGGPGTVESTLSELIRTTSDLAKRRIGALIVVERQQGLRDYAERGTRIDAEVSCDLLMNIFTPGAPLHDGAVIVQGDRIAAAACFLPLTRQSVLDHDLGTRHRAALGISEQTDSVAMVVSEETGEISLAIAGNLERGLDSASLHDSFLSLFASEASTSESSE